MGLVETALFYVNKVGAYTIGLVVQAATGNVDPWTRDAMKLECAESAVRSLGPNPDPVIVARVQQQCYADVDATLRSGHASPGQCIARLPGVGCVAGEDSGEGLRALQKIVNVLIIGGVLVGVYFVAREFGVMGWFRGSSRRSRG